MLEVLIDFAGLLRRQGIRLSTSELSDAAEAVSAVGLDDRETLRCALEASLIKRPLDREIFRRAFDAYFAAPELMDAGRGLGIEEVLERLRQGGLSDAAIAVLLEEVGGDLRQLGDLLRLAFGLDGGSMELLRRLDQVAGRIGIDRLRAPMQIGFFSHRLLDELDFAGGQRELDALLARLGDRLTSDERDQLGVVFNSRMSELRDAVRRWVAHEEQRASVSRDRDAVRALARRPLVSLTEREIKELRGEVARLARLFRARRKLEARRRGRLDVRMTLRRSLATMGIPFDVHVRAPRPRRPRLVVLCDISDSVRAVSRFSLELVYALWAQFERVESFAFVAEVGELSPLFRDHPVDRALELAYSGAVVNVLANSNYGHVLATFANRHLGRIQRRTSVVIIGDGRNNYHPPRTDALAAIGRAAKQILWITSEPRSLWGSGDSVMDEYARYCDQVAVVRDLDSLRDAIAQLMGAERTLRKDGRGQHAAA